MNSLNTTMESQQQTIRDNISQPDTHDMAIQVDCADDMPDLKKSFASLKDGPS